MFALYTAVLSEYLFVSEP